MSLSALGLTALCLVVPPYFGFGGCCASEPDNISKDRSLVPFMALRPLTTLQIVEAKVQATVRMALRLACLSLAVAGAVILLPTSMDGHYRPTLVPLAHILSGPQVLGLLALYALVILGGIKTSVSGIWCALGRLALWAILLISVAPIILGLVVIARLVTHPDEIPRFLIFLPKLIWVLTAMKLMALTLTIPRLRQSRLVPDALIVRWFVGCAVAGVAIFGFAYWTVPASTYSRWVIAAQISCMLPLVRVALSPLFVHRGRHG